MIQLQIHTIVCMLRYYKTEKGKTASKYYQLQSYTAGLLLFAPSGRNAVSWLWGRKMTASNYILGNYTAYYMIFCRNEIIYSSKSYNPSINPYTHSNLHCLPPSPSHNLINSTWWSSLAYLSYLVIGPGGKIWFTHVAACLISSWPECSQITYKIALAALCLTVWQAWSVLITPSWIWCEICMCSQFPHHYYLVWWVLGLGLGMMLGSG